MSKGIQRKNSFRTVGAAMKAYTALHAGVSTSSIQTPDDCFPRKPANLPQIRTPPVRAAPSHFGCTLHALLRARMPHRLLSVQADDSLAHAPGASVPADRRRRPPQPRAARLLPELLLHAAARLGGEHGTAWSCNGNGPFPLPAVRHAWPTEDPPGRAVEGWRSSHACLPVVQLVPLGNRQAQLDKPPWSGSRQHYRCPGCGGRVGWHIHGPAWRPGGLSSTAAAG
jgi:hypothetical protein